jgi:hypothetical protein
VRDLWTCLPAGRSRFITRQQIRPGNVPHHGKPSEPPDLCRRSFPAKAHADPQVRPRPAEALREGGWCGSGELITPRDPLSGRICLSLLLGMEYASLLLERRTVMRRVLMVCLVMAAVASVALDGGDKNRGDKGKGNVHQVVGP